MTEEVVMPYVENSELFLLQFINTARLRHNTVAKKKAMMARLKKTGLHAEPETLALIEKFINEVI